MNTTFTTCAEKKAKQILNLLQGYTKGIRITAILILLLMGVNNAWAVNHTGGYVYFLKPSTWTESKVMMFIGHNSYTSVYEMTKVDNTDNLYRYTMPSWGGATYVAFANAGSVWGSGNWGPSNRTNATHYTNVYNDYGFNSGSYYVVVPASTSNNAGITIKYTGTTASTINLTTEAVASDKARGTVSVSGYHMSAYNTASTRSAVSSSASNATASTTLAPGSTATFKATASTGYEFEGWYDATTGGNQLSTNSTYTFKYDISYTGKTVYARFKAKQYTITYKDKGNVTFTGENSASLPTTHTYGTATNLVDATKSGWDFLGWYTTSECTSNAITTLDATTYTSNITLYANWKKNEVYYTVTSGVIGSNGTLIVSPAQDKYLANTLITFTATPNSGYEVEGWYSDEDGNNKIAEASNSYTITITADTRVYVKFKATTYNITYNLDGGTNHADNPTNYTIETPTITLKDPTKTGYTFNGWYSEAGFTNNVTEIATGSTGNKTFYAKWTENTVTISPTNAYDHGNPGYANPTASNSGKIGISSTSQLVAPSPGEGYTFVGWTLSDNIVVTTGNASSNRTITVRHKTGDGSAVSAVANYNENLDSHWHLVGSDNIFPDDWNVSNNSMMKKRSGSTSEKKVYMTININDVSDIKTYEFKVVDDNGNDSDKWYGYSSGNNFLEWTETSTKNVYTTTQEYNNDNNLKFTPNAVGDYEFKVDYSDGNPKVTITYPELGGQSIYLVGEFNWTPDNSNKFTETSEGSGVYQLTKHFDARDRHQTTTQPQAEYEFKLNINNTNYTVEGDGNEKHLQYTRQSTSKVINDGTSYSGPYYNLLLQADITGDYVFTYDAATQTLTVTHPEYEPKASYLVGDFSDGDTDTDNLPKDGGEGMDWTEAYGIPITVNGNTGSVEVCNWPEGTWEFKVKINGLWYGLKDLNITQSGIYELTDAYAEMGDRNISITTHNDECYSFMYTQNNDGTLDLLVIYGNETHKVIFDQNGHGTAPAQQTILYGKTATKPIMDDADGYMFAGWYTNRDCTAGNEYDFDTPVESDIKLYAKWIPYTQCIFFKNNLKWNNVYVYTFNNEVWHNGDNNEDPKDDKGVQPKENRIEYGKMTQIGETDIYYYILTNLTGFSRIAFSEKDMHDYGFFYDSKAIYRADRSDQMSLFIPQTDQKPTTANNTKYYSSGIWMKYNSTESGYDWRGSTVENDANQWSKSHSFSADKAGGYSFKASVTFDNVDKHFFKIHNIKGDWFGNGGTMGQNNCTDWIFGVDNGYNAKITPTVTGTYIFTIYLGDGEVKVSLDYPLTIGDYRLAYKDNTANSHHPGHYLKKRSTSQTDTVSFFIHHDQYPEIIVEKCTKITDGVPTWDKVTEITINPAFSITESGVYNFYLQQIENEALPILVNQATPYTGNYYIRTDAADGGWDSFRQKSNEITYSSFADKHSNFNHYYCKYIDAGRNVKFTIANDYSYCISDTLDNDDIITEGQSSIGCLPINANVRFGWDSNTNEISRAYIKGAGMTSDRFLVLQGLDDNLKDANGNVIPEGTGVRKGLGAHEEILVDQQNWIYQVDVTANNQTFIKLIAEYNGAVQYFKGDAENYARLLSSTATNSYKIRLVYDFKSNNLVAAMVLDGDKEVTEDDALGTDMMVIRKNQGKAEQLTFDPKKELSDVGTVYAVMTFTSGWINGSATTRERSLYWVSFPFDVKISDVFGFGEYAEHWIIQYYDGAERAEKGLFIDSGTYWKYIEDTKTTLKAGQGYVLALDLSKVEFLHGAEEVSLYFPSIKPLTTISGELPTKDTVPEHWCNIDREWKDGETTYHHKYTDSHWNLIGVPGFADIKSFDVTSYHFMQDDASFYYNFSLASSTYAVESSATNFQAMYAYMVQFAGEINWKSKTVSVLAPPASIAARRNSDSQPEKITLRLELAQADKKVDQTFVQLQQEGATANFDLSLDLTKIMNSGFSNIYTLTDSLKIQVAGNALPMEETVVPVGVNIATAGEYTFRMPNGTEGMVVELIDYERDITTNLLLFDYTVTLPAGSNESRFALHIQPNKSGVTTGVENVGDKAKGIEKYLIDGKLMIRTAEGVFDAQGKRL